MRDNEHNLIWESYQQVNEGFRDFTDVVWHAVNDPEMMELGEKEMVTAVINLALKSNVSTGHDRYLGGVDDPKFRAEVAQHIQELLPSRSKDAPYLGQGRTPGYKPMF